MNKMILTAIFFVLFLSFETNAKDGLYNPTVKSPDNGGYGFQDIQFCNDTHVLDAAANANTPDYDEIIHDKTYKELPPEQSIWHNFKQDFNPRNPGELVSGMIVAWSEYQKLQTGITNPSEFKYLDPSLPNVKFVRDGGHQEVVFNKSTKEKITSGINMGTANVGTNPASLAHAGDVIRFAMCGTPKDFQRALGEKLASDPDALDQWLQLSNNPVLMNDFAKSLGLTTYDLQCISETYKVAQDKTKKMFVRENESNVVASIDTSKHETESTKSKSNDVRDDSLATANESVPTVMKKATEASKDVKKAIEEFHINFLSLPNSQFKWQQIQAYLDLVVSLDSWTLPPEKVLNKLVQDGSIIRTRNNTWKDLVESPLASDDSKSCWVKEKVGIRGWCRCQPPHVTPIYEHAWLGAYVEAIAFDGQREQNDIVSLLSCQVCKQCGKCYTYRRMGDDSDDVEFHIWPYEEAIDVHISQTHKIVAARKKMEDAILSIPDGEIVVPIRKECSCKHRSDEKPNLVAFYEGQKNEKGHRRYVCADCSGLYNPDNTCNSTVK